MSFTDLSHGVVVAVLAVVELPSGAPRSLSGGTVGREELERSTGGIERHHFVVGRSNRCFIAMSLKPSGLLCVFSSDDSFTLTVKLSYPVADLDAEVARGQ